MRFILYPFSIILDIITTIRNWLFDYNILKSKSHSIPIICVGNLSIGGSGKTPHTDYLVDLLKNKYNIAVLSRGYGRKTNDFLYVENNSIVKNVGDESLLIKKRHPSIIVAVDNNRNKGVKRILKDYPTINVILLDDGFQHRKLKAGFNILLTPFHKPLFNDYLFPSGSLRENSKNAKRANIVIITKCPKNLTPIKKNKLQSKLNLYNYQEVFFSSINYMNWKCINTGNIITNNEKYSITLVTAIHNSRLLINMLKEQGHNVIHIKFQDHHLYTLQDIYKMLKLYNKDNSIKKIILTTEKDAVKIIEFKEYLKNTNIYMTPIRITFDKQEIFNKKILKYVKEHTRNNKILKKQY